MRQACIILQMNQNTFIRHAKRLGCYRPNPTAKGQRKGPGKSVKYTLEEILSGVPTTVHTYKLKLRLLKAKIFEYMCMSCGLTQWRGLPIPLELHHVDGNSTNHKKENLQLLCPNCHALTDTYRAKNKRQAPSHSSANTSHVPA